MKPRIGVVSRYEDKRYPTNASYIQAVADNGGIPVQLPLVDIDDAERLIGCVDGLLITGGPDVSTLLYGEEPCNKMGACCRHNDDMEIALIRAAMAAGKPVLGICRGIQVINVALGGTLYQDIPSQLPACGLHFQPSAREELTHTVNIVPGTYAHRIFGCEKIHVNTFHHQAVKDLGKGLTISAYSADGLVEAVEDADGMVFGVQWHPENLQMLYPEHKVIFTAFIDRC